MEVSEFAPILNEIGNLDSSSLVIFDIDETLIMVKDKILRPSGEKHIFALSSRMGNHLTNEEQRVLRSITMLQREIVYTDPNLPLVFHKLKEMNIPFIALTAVAPGEYGVIPSIEEWRREELIRFGIDFSSHPQHDTIFPLTELGENPPLFYKGILCSSTYPKGVALKAFLEKSGIKPNKVLFVDDMRGHLTSVEEELTKMDIPFLGFHFTRVNNLKDEISEELAAFQFKFLIENKKWLSDEEALTRIKKT